MSQVPRAVVIAVDSRDNHIDQLTGQQIGAGRNLHHRWLRSSGERHTAGNLVTLSGSGTTGTHGWVHHHREAARLLGFIIPAWCRDVAAVPILLTDARGRRAWHLLDDAGGVRLLSDARAEAVMRELGVWTVDDHPDIAALLH